MKIRFDYENINKSYIERLKDSYVLIVGASVRSGVSVANILYSLDIKYALSDSKSYEELETSRAKLINKDSIFFYGKQTENQLENIDLIILSPGVPMSIDILQLAKSKNIKIISEIEFAYRILKDNKYIAITGTDGKTTTTILIDFICSKDTSSHALGNVGDTFTENIINIKNNDTIVLELSSFQLETIDKLKPNISAILNLACDHLDRYADMDKYFEAKRNIYKNQDKNDALILNHDNPYTNSLIADKSTANVSVFTFSLKNNNASIYLDEDDNVYFENKNIFSIKNIKLKGSHNKENILAAILITIKHNIPIDIIEKSVLEFEAVAHRMEFIREFNGIEYYNDSKATTVQSVIKAIQSFDENIILIMGGRNKAMDFAPISEYVKSHCKAIIFTGEARTEFSSMIDFDNKHIIEDFDEALHYASSIASNNDKIILSPGGTSFDRFNSYVDRGLYFKKLVLSIK